MDHDDPDETGAGGGAAENVALADRMIDPTPFMGRRVDVVVTHRPADGQSGHTVYRGTAAGLDPSLSLHLTDGVTTTRHGAARSASVATDASKTTSDVFVKGSNVLFIGIPK